MLNSIQMLKVTTMMLAAQVRVLHSQERTAHAKRDLYFQSQCQRLRKQLRKTLRSHNLAYAFLIGNTYAQTEEHNYTEPNWPQVGSIAKEYTPFGKGFHATKFSQWVVGEYSKSVTIGELIVKQMEKNNA